MSDETPENDNPLADPPAEQPTEPPVDGPDDGVVNTPAPMTPAQLLHSAQQAEQEAKALRHQAALLVMAIQDARRPKEPAIPADGQSVTVVFSKYQGGHNYDFAAVGFRSGSTVRWAVTGSNTGRFNWSGLLSFIGEANWSTLEVVTKTEYIGPPPGSEPAVEETMGQFGQVKATVVDPFTIGRVGYASGGILNKQDAVRYPYDYTLGRYPGDHIGNY